jgi:DNA processing protein
MNEKSYYLGFSCFSGIGPKKLQLLLKEFGTAKASWEASSEDLVRVLGKALTPQLIAFRKQFSIQEYEQKLKKQNVWYLTLEDEGYPALLKQIKKPPFIFFGKGNKEILKQVQDDPLMTLPAGRQGSGQVRTIAIVGTRKITQYGKQVTESLTSDLVANGFYIVSGLALGVDAAAHRVCVENGGNTIAVLGCGVDCCSPEENSYLYDRILETGGAIISEYPLGKSPTKGSFPSRNRIIAGLSQGVVVTEGAADSGALYTAEEAFALGRPVFAVPGPITSSLSKGPHSLIGKGGKLISGAEEIVAELGLKIKDSRKGGDPTSPRLRQGFVRQARLRGASKDEQRIIDLLQNESMHFDELVKRTKISSSKLGSILSMMEMKGIIKSLDSGFFSL